MFSESLKMRTSGAVPPVVVGGSVGTNTGLLEEVLNTSFWGMVIAEQLGGDWKGVKCDGEGEVEDHVQKKTEVAIWQTPKFHQILVWCSDWFPSDLLLLVLLRCVSACYNSSQSGTFRSRYAGFPFLEEPLCSTAYVSNQKPTLYGHGPFFYNAPVEVR